MSILFLYDLAAFRRLNELVLLGPRFDRLAAFGADWLGYLLIAVLFLILAGSFFPKYRRWRTENLAMAGSAAVAAIFARYGIAEAVRFFWSRPRPFEVVSDVHQLIIHGRGGSFPSGHALFYFAIAGAVCRYHPKTGIFFTLGASAIGLARIIAGIHWPSDVAAGALLGFASGFLLANAAQSFGIQKRISVRKAV